MESIRENHIERSVYPVYCNGAEVLDVYRNPERNRIDIVVRQDQKPQSKFKLWILKWRPPRIRFERDWDYE